MDDKQTKTVEEGTRVRNSTVRLIISLLLLVVQVVIIFLLVNKLQEKVVWISVVLAIISVCTVLYVYGGDENAAIKMPWIILIMALPVLGIVLYVLLGTRNATKKMRKRYEAIDRRLLPALRQEDGVIEHLREQDPATAGISNYLWKTAHYPTWENTDVTYYDDGLTGLNAQVEDLETAEHFIFMEYHAIEDAQSFERVKKILARKAKEGVDVRLFYDDMGSAGFIDHDFMERMEALGIQCRVFNPINPLLNVFMNNRDHRKITVIDGRVGFTGGYNLANEYFHLTSPFGFWKDTGVRLEGDAVRSLTITFLENWYAAAGEEAEDKDFEIFLPRTNHIAKGSAGFVTPYADSPLDKVRVGENVYMSMLNKAAGYCYIVTPYLLVTDELARAFALAAKRGVDVRLITPGIPDKKFIYKMTRSYYHQLTKHGVRIYEYSPGFCHAKMCVTDDEAAVVGTINLDYRSLYLHFENACLFAECPQVAEVRKDFEAMFKESKEVTQEYNEGRNTFLRIGQCILRLFAPLM